MNSSNSNNSKQISELYHKNKELIALFTEQQVGAKRVQILKWVRDLLEKPKHAVKEEERLKAIDNDVLFIASISNGNSDFRMNYFNGVVNDLLQEFKNASPIKEGNIFMRSFTLKLWKLKKVRLDLTSKQLYVLSKNEKVFDLTTYAFKRVGTRKEYQAFVLDSIASSNKYKQIMFAWLSEEGMKIWYDELLKCKNEGTDAAGQQDDVHSQLNQSVLSSHNDLSKSYSHPVSQLTLPSQNDLKVVHSTGKLEEDSYEFEKAEKPKEHLFSSNSLPSPGVSPLQAQQIERKKQEQDNAKPVAMFEEPKSSGLLHLQKSSSNNSELKESNSPITSQKGKHIVVPSKLDGSDEAASTPATVSVHGKPPTEAGAQKQNSMVQVIPQTNNSNVEIQQQQQQQKEESLLDMSFIRNMDQNEEKRVPRAISQFLSEYHLDSLSDDNNFKTISFTNGMRFLQNNDDPRKFKLFLAFQGVSAFDAFNCICCSDEYNKWNNNVAETKLLNIMKNESTAIIYQKHKGIGIMYRPRDFVYLRHAFVQKDTYFLIDKSIQYDSLPSSLSIVRGEIEHNVWSFQPHPNDETRSLMIGEFFFNNSGYSNKEQDASITYTYLQNFSNLSGFLAQKSFSNKSTFNIFGLQDNGLMKKSILRMAMGEDNNRLQHSYLIDGEDLKYSQEFSRSDHRNNSASSVSASAASAARTGNSVITEQDEEHEERLSNEHTMKSKHGSSPTMHATAEEDENALRAANYIEEENQNAELNRDLRKFSEACLNLEEITRSGSSGKNSSLIARRDGDKLANLSIMDIIEMVEKDKHWGLCLDQRFCMTTIPHEGKRQVSDMVNGHYQFKNDWERDAKTGKFIFLNKDKIAAQKKVISFILSKIGSNIISGKSVTTISLPIDIFETRSNLERFAYSCSFAPIYLRRAGESTNPIEQMKNVGLYLITTTIMYLNLEKPFNPILGETFQGRLEGDPFYVEQISHHPPICAFQYYTDSFMLNAQLESIANIHANSVTGINQGNIRVDFLKTKNSIGMIQAPGSLNGTAFGTRYMSVDGKYIAYDLTNKLVFEVKVNPEKKGLFKSATVTMDYFAGGIYRVTDKFIAKFKALKPSYYKFQGLNMKEDIVEQVSVINGIWNKEIFIDDKKVFDIDDIGPPVLEYEINPIPSDSNYRQDILALRDGNKKVGQEFKEKLEVIQRADRKLREKAAEKRKKDLKKAKK